MNIAFIQDFTVVLLAAGLAGAVCRRLGASVTIGYLLAGIVVGPYALPFTFVSDIDTIKTLSQLGLIFLMFSTGMGLSFRKLRQMGGALFVAVLCCALTVIAIVRTGGAIFMAKPFAAMFIAGMLVSSSSAIISRILHEGGFIHRMSGQLAMTITLLEDLAAIILFSVVGTYAAADSMPLIRETGAFFAFLALVLIASLILIPRFLSSIQRNLQTELQTLLVAGILCLLAVLSTRAGYSPALGAFLLGLIVAGTPQHAAIERTFTGLRDIFSAVFFVSIGMLIDVQILHNPWILLLLFICAVGAILIRLTAATFGLLFAGYKGRDVFPAALTLTVTGEFSFIFAQLGISRGVLPESTHAFTVGVCVLSAAFASVAVPRSEKLTAFLAAHQPRLLERAISGWQKLLNTFKKLGHSNMLWNFSKKRFRQISVEMLFITGLMIFAEPLRERIETFFVPNFAGSQHLAIIFWTAFGILLLAPLIAVWRNIGTLAMLYAQAAFLEESRQTYRAAILENLIKLIAAGFLAGWLWMFWPAHFASLWIPFILAGILGVMILLFWRKMIFWHSILEGHIQRALHSEGLTKPKAWREKTVDWNINIGECVIPDYSPHGGRSIAELGLRSMFHCAIIAIDRQGYLLMNPKAPDIVYPQDKLLLLGLDQHIAQTREWLSGGNTQINDDANLGDIHFETITVPDDSPHLNKSLSTLNISGNLGAQIIGIRRAGNEHINPSADATLQSGDELLTLGLPRQIRSFREWLAGM